MPLCVFTFSTPIFNYTSLNILNILLTFFWLIFSFAVLFGISVYVLLYCTFPSIGYTATSQFYCSFFFLVLHSRYRIFLFSCSNTLSFIVFFYTLHPCYFFSFCFFLSLVSCFLAQITSYISHLSFKKKFLFSVFIGLNLFVFIFSTVYIHCYYLFYQPFSLKQKYAFWRHVLLIIFLYFFLCRIYWFPFLLCLLQSGYICCFLFSSSLFLWYNVWTLLFIVLYLPISKILYFFFLSFLPLYLDLFFYFIPYHLIHQYFRLVSRDQFSLFFFNAISIVMGQVPELPTIETFFPLSSFQFCS